VKTEKKEFSTTITEHKVQGIINSLLWAVMKSLGVTTFFTYIFVCAWHIDFLAENKNLSSRIIAIQHKTSLTPPHTIPHFILK
jgi:hypothetical protein